MANTFKLRIGGKAGYTSATDYSTKLIRCSYKKHFCNDGDFDCIIDSVSKSVDTGIAIDNNVFFLSHETGIGTTYRCLFKGIIDKVTWSGKNRCQIFGRQCMRGTSGASGTLQGKRSPSLFEKVATGLNDLLNNTTIYDDSLDSKDGGATGEGNPLRGW